MSKIIFIFSCILILTACQRQKLNELSVNFNESLIKPPSNVLVLPGSTKTALKSNNDLNNEFISKDVKLTNNSNLINQILQKTNSQNSVDSIRDIIDYNNGYKNEEGFFEWLLKPAHQRTKENKASRVIDPLNPNSN